MSKVMTEAVMNRMRQTAAELACEMGKAIYYSFAAFRKTTNNSNN